MDFKYFPGFAGLRVVLKKQRKTAVKTADFGV